MTSFILLLKFTQFLKSLIFMYSLLIMMDLSFNYLRTDKMGIALFQALTLQRFNALESDIFYFWDHNCSISLWKVF